MLSTIRNRKEKGFTIIEVLIVLAIAGLILLVVFLAVPALQRNARNTQRKEDVASIMGGISEFVNNNGGRLPESLGADANTLILQGPNGGGNHVPVALGFYAPGEVTIAAFSSGQNSTDDETVVLLRGAQCDPDAADIGDAQSASSRRIAALFTLEPDAKQCSES